jgi:hypothetical protein
MILNKKLILRSTMFADFKTRYWQGIKQESETKWGLIQNITPPPPQYISPVAGTLYKPLHAVAWL